jgi:para-nitrobenzyl esterase
MTGRRDHATAINRRTALIGLGLGTGFAAMRWSSGAAAQDPVVETACGKIRGTEQSGVIVFRGIRYGESTATSRFLPPVAAKPWAGAVDAKVAGNSAPQIPGAAYPIAAWYTKIEPVSEDCLFLNVFTPSATQGANKPVMVWLHGGAWMNCAGSAPGFDGTNLARDGDVVVVTINHRVNIFGHLKVESRDERFADSGNTGVLDMVVALRWVRDNITEFGGDPGNVTIFGQSGGAAKVATLMAVPPARGLFHKAIMQSFSGGAHMRTAEEAARMAHDVAVAAGLARADAEALQALPMDKLIATMKVMTAAVYPIIDNKNFSHHPYDPVMAEGAADIPLLIGNAATEATWFMGGDMKNFDLQDADARNRIGRHLSIDAAETNRVIDIYRASLTNPTPSDLLIAIVTDFQFRKNTTSFAAMRASQGAAPVYYYVFDWRTPVYGGMLRTPHTLEVPFVFGSTEAAAASVGNGPELAALTKTVQSIWTSFARTGSPQTTAIPEWPKYQSQTKPAMTIDLDSKVAQDPGGVAGQAIANLPAYEYAVPLSYIRP